MNKLDYFKIDITIILWYDKIPNFDDSVYALASQDGRIDYNEFVAMMQKGNADLSKRGRKGSTSFRIFREALPVC